MKHDIEKGIRDVQSEIKGQKMKKTAVLSRLMPYLMQHKGLFAVCVLLTIGGNLLGLAGP